MVSTAAFHARVRGSVPGLGGLKETKMFLPHPRVKVSIVGSLRDREVACSASDRQSSNFESCVWRTVSSQSSHHPQEVLLAQFSLYVHKGGLKPDSFHFISFPVTPLLKKATLEPNTLKNYRPLSKLPYLSKVFERIVFRRLLDYLNITNKYGPHQSAYSPPHSTETALVRVSNDILMVLDQHKAAMLVLLDLSVAFDTIDHGMLLNRLQILGVRTLIMIGLCHI